MLKQLRIAKEIELLRTSLVVLDAKRDSFKTRSTELTASMEEAKTEDDLKLVDEEIAKIETESTENEAQSTKVTEKIAELEAELSELDERAKAEPSKASEKRGGTENMNREMLRELRKSGAYYERADVKAFYAELPNIRSITGEGLAIPEIVVGQIMDILGDYSTLYPLVNKIRTNSKARILIDTDEAAAGWLEATAAFTAASTGTITSISFDGYKIGKVTLVDNCMLQDSIINLDAYVTKKIARSIAKGLDLAILKGTGSSFYQPEGIIPGLDEANDIEVLATSLADIVGAIGLIDAGDDSIGEVVAVMKRQTYYNRLLGFSIQTDVNGNVVGKLPNIKNPDLLGIRVVFNNHMTVDEILFGDFEKYTIVERESIIIESSKDVKFVEDQTAFRGKGRFDGKPTKAEAFARITLVDVIGA